MSRLKLHPHPVSLFSIKMKNCTFYIMYCLDIFNFMLQVLCFCAQTCSAAPCTSDHALQQDHLGWIRYKKQGEGEKDWICKSVVFAAHHIGRCAWMIVKQYANTSAVVVKPSRCLPDCFGKVRNFASCLHFSSRAAHNCVGGDM